MQFSKIAVVIVAALVCTSSAARGHMFENDVAKNPFDVNRYGNGALVVQPKARAVTADQETVTVTITTIPDYCNTALPMIPLLFPTTSAQNSTFPTVIKTLVPVTSETSAQTTSSATEAASASPSASAAGTSAAASSSASNAASMTSPTTPTGSSAKPAHATSTTPTSNDADAKHFNGALIPVLIALTGNVIFLI
ncbi:MAG: hypothetical protein FRX48_07355 [Lasallia pustulata]|uniref:Uncharacterized protein n=1 Tax=Lasallia pustulata TaxID=136370 RepID=A0A5M8PHZ8_9LECA|nr:MAG: hypothetical protein FRX48_07355 [Lasallia pustulata]